MKPIWAAYHRWPGVYGSVDDALYQITKAINRVTPTEVNFLNQERLDYLKFRNSGAKQPRYRALFSGLEDLPYFPHHFSDDSDLPTFTISTAPNTRLTELLMLKTLERNTQRILKSQLFKRYPYTLYLLNSCSTREQAMVALDHIRQLEKNLNPKKSISRLNGIQPSKYQVFEQSLDHLGLVGIDEWSLELDSPMDRITYYTTGLLAHSAQTRMLERAMQKVLFPIKGDSCEPMSYEGFYMGETSTGTDFLEFINKISNVHFCPQNCDVAAQKSKAELSQPPLSRAALQSDAKDKVQALSLNARRNIVETCANCHDRADGQLIGPRIPFLSDRKSLAQFEYDIERRIRPDAKSTYDGGSRMPFAQEPLTESERQTLLNYVRGH